MIWICTLWAVAFWLFYKLALSAYRDVSTRGWAMTDLAMPKMFGWLAIAPVGPPPDALVDRIDRVRLYLDTAVEQK